MDVHMVGQDVRRLDGWRGLPAEAPPASNRSERARLLRYEFTQMLVMSPDVENGKNTKPFTRVPMKFTELLV